MAEPERNGGRTVQLQAERELVGAVLAVVAHEANNRLATLQEGVGLLGDLLGAARGGAGETLRECRRAAAGLEPQLAQLGELTRRLGRFADAVRAGGRTDAAGALEDLLALTERLSRQARVRVVRELAAGLPPVAADPAAFLALAQRLLALALARCPAGGTVRVVAASADGGRAVRVAFRSGRGAGALADPTARALAGALAAELKDDLVEGEVTVRLASAG